MDLGIENWQQLAAALFAMIAVAGTIFSLATPLLTKDALKSRMKSVATEREKLRARERARLQASHGADPRAALRNQPKANLKNFVDKWNLKDALSDEKTHEQLRMAGYRGTAPLYYYLVARVGVPLALFVISLFYALVVLPDNLPVVTKICICLGISVLGAFLPNVFLKNKIDKRRKLIQRAWPDALDLMLICVESGMAIEGIFAKIAEEIGAQCVELAEELSVTTAELSYLDERRQAYENLAKRTNVENIKNVMMALIQAELYGTPIGSTLRTMSDDAREERMQAAEAKAAALPPKLTVPMMIFFLPVLFFIIMTPAVIQVMDTFSG